MELFIDTTFGITVGILDKSYKWLDYKFIEGKKGSAVIHRLIYDLLENNKLKTKDITRLLQVSGPGSYTGMRVSEGIANIFNWQGFEVNSFYHFDVPKLLGVKEGCWITDAFKGESFCFSWNGEDEKSELMKSNDILIPSDIPMFTLKNKEDTNFIETQSLIKEKSEELFKRVVELNMKKDLYYFRTIEMEFTKAKTV